MMWVAFLSVLAILFLSLAHGLVSSPMVTSVPSTGPAVPPAHRGQDAYERALGGGGEARSRQLQRWLTRAYSESGAHAAFGDYPSENLDAPCLQQTAAALRIMMSNVREDPIATLDTAEDWIRTLQTPGGLYDDPRTDAPVTLETYWALDILATIGAAPEDPARVRQAVLAGMPPVDAFSPSQSARALLQALGDTGVSARCLELLEGRPALTRDPDLAWLRESVANLLSVQPISGNSRAAWTVDDQVTLEVAILAAWVIGAEDSLPAQIILTQRLSRLHEYGAGYLEEGSLLVLIEAAERALAWTDIPDDIRHDVASYIERTEPTSESWAGYCHAVGEWSWVDPSLNVARTRLCAIARLSNRAIASLLGELALIRCGAGWSTVMFALPALDWTYYGTRIAQAAGSSGVNWNKVAAYARDSLFELDPPPEALLSAVRTLVCLDALQQADRAAVAAHIERTWRRSSEADLDIGSSAALLDAIAAAPSDVARRHLVARAVALSADVFALRPGALAELARLHRLLGENVVPVETLQVAIGRLAAPSGGFRIAADAPAADLMSTYHCTQALASLDCLDALDADGMRRFVLACWSSYGFQLVRPEDAAAVGSVTEPDLVSTYMAVDILSRLDAMPKSP